MSLTKILLTENDDIPYELFEMRDEIMYNALIELKDATSDDIKQSWSVLPFHLVKRVWESFVKLGFVRHDKQVDKMADLVIENILKLDVNTELSGHKTSYPYDEMESLGIADNESEASQIMRDWDERIYNYLYDPNSGQMRISDYAMDKLGALAFKLYRATTSEEKLLIIDKVFNVVHRRSDIAGLFVEGGSNNLSKLSEK